MKGSNATFQKEYHESNIDPQKFPFLAYNIFFKSPDFLIFKNSYDYLRSSIWNKLILRKKLKNLIKYKKNPEIRQNYENKAELIKLMLNSCYRYSL